MRIGVIGLGVIAPFFLRAVERDPELKLTAVCDLDPERLREHPDGVTTFTDHRELLASGAVDAVVVTLPNGVHAEVVADALRAGVHVCCEKPLTVDPVDADRLAGLSAEHGATLFTAFHRRYNRHVVDLAANLPDRSRITGVRARYSERIEDHTGSDRWYLDLDRCGGGCVIDNGPNALDALQLVLGDLTLVTATIGDVRAGVEFCAELELRTIDGVPVTVELDWALPAGEVKDITVHLDDGTTVTADMLAGYEAFKSSLHHEYEGIMAGFRSAVAAGPAHQDEGPGVVRLVDAAYRVARSREQRLRMTSKAPVAATVVKSLFHRRDDRGMVLSPWRSRCVRAGEIHELVTTTDRPQLEGDRVDRVGFLGFAEFHAGTVLERGDEMWWGGTLIGTVAGFDECHAPNHYNVLVDVDRVVSAETVDLRPGERLTFKEPAVSENSSTNDAGVRPVPVSPTAAAAFPGVEVLLVAAGVRAGGLAEAAEARWRQAHATWHGASKAAVREHPRVAAYRALSELVGVDPDRQAPSVQALVDRGLRTKPEGSWPRINPVVDAVNAVAVTDMTALGVFDADRVRGEVVLRTSRAGEPFLALGASGPVELEGGRLVLADDERVLSLFAHRDGVHQAVRADSRRVLLLGCAVPGVEVDAVRDSLLRTAALVSGAAAGRQ